MNHQGGGKMIKLYFGSVASTISTILILLFGLFFGLATARRSSVTFWGILVLVMLLLGLFMSIMSGLKDGMATASQLIPKGHWSMAVLSILGGLAFLVGIAAIFVRNQAFWQVCFYVLSSIVIVKTLLTEGIRLAHYFTHLS
jgi:hypothetical protein